MFAQFFITIQLIFFSLHFTLIYEQYLIDPLIRGAVLKDIEMDGSIVIMDEAHNVPNVCESSASAAITSTEIIIALRDMKFVGFSIDTH